MRAARHGRQPGQGELFEAVGNVAALDARTRRKTAGASPEHHGTRRCARRAGAPRTRAGAAGAFLGRADPFCAVRGVWERQRAGASRIIAC
jgi:hypothetical protein